VQQIGPYSPSLLISCSVTANSGISHSWHDHANIDQTITQDNFQSHILVTEIALDERPARMAPERRHALLCRGRPRTCATGLLAARPARASQAAQSRLAGAVTTSNPIPSSRTSRCRTSPIRCSSRVTVLARAWLTTLVSASCATRKQAVSMAASTRSRAGSAKHLTRRPASRAGWSRYQRNAGSSPKSSNSDGRSSPESWRTCCRTRSRPATLPSRHPTKAVRPSRRCAPCTSNLHRR
jgi:hypothetical protein